MKIGIYNRYWNTRGGGEKHAGALAESLARRHDVDLIGVEETDCTELGRHLLLDLRRTRFVQWPNLPCAELSDATAEYDLFINATYCSYLYSKAARSMYLVFFPQRVGSSRVLTLSSRIARTAARLVRPAIEPVAGCFPSEGDFYWTSEEAVLRIWPRAFELRQAIIPLHTHGGDGGSDSIIDASAEAATVDVKTDRIVVTVDRKPSEPVLLTITCRVFVPSAQHLNEDTRQLGIAIETSAQRAWHRSLLAIGTRIDGLRRQMDPSFIGSYDLLVANSQFTRTWIKRRWDRQSSVLNPPVDTRVFRPSSLADKRKVILSVGRFFHGGHNKKHVALLKSFRTMVDRGLMPVDWEYHLVGGVHRQSIQDIEYYADVRRLARGYPVRILPDLSFDELVREYREASMFWHAGGWGERESASPERFEHFGITTCEAMSAGCIPVVIGKAGQLEIVQHGLNGFVFHNRTELIACTLRIIEAGGSAWAREIARNAMERAEAFGRETFDANVEAIVG